MFQSGLSGEELRRVFGSFADEVWIIQPGSGRVEIIQDQMMPELNGTASGYEELLDIYKRELVYSSDVWLFDKIMSPEGLLRMVGEGCSEKRFDMRFYSDLSGFEWHEGCLRVLDGRAGAERILLTGRNVNEQRRAQIVQAAVRSEYDYVVYIEADKNSYVMYTSNQDTDTPVPPLASNDYEGEVAKFHERYAPVEMQDSLTEKLSISNVRQMLEKSGEYVVYGKIFEGNRVRDKKMRFSYYDRERNIWFLTRTDITEIKEEKRQRQLLQDALQAANAANAAKSEFLSRMSHDIRTPMNAIIGMTAIAGLHLDDKKRLQKCLKDITSSSKLLLSLINEVLDMSKLESGRLSLVEEEFNLSELLQELIAIIQTPVGEKRHDFFIHVNGVKHEALAGDVQRIQQVLLNLLSNAIKYTPEHGKIVLDINEKSTDRSGYAKFEFRVSDNGIGMKPEFLEKIFEPFERAEEQAIRNIQGTGLGMSISRNIVHMMNGDISVESVYGKGSVFTAEVQLKVLTQEEMRPEILYELPVLVVDDDEISCENACISLKEIGMKGEWVLSGTEAVARVSVAHEAGDDFFAVIIDLVMPDMNGIETAAAIRRLVGRQVPIIMISAYSWVEYEEAAKEAGVDAFVSKPLLKSNLYHILKEFALGTGKVKEIGNDTLRLSDLTGRRILVVEDNDLNREIAEELLNESGAVTEPAVNGREAVDMVAASQEGYYDLILMDIQMPVMNGIEATETIRAMERGDAQSVPIIAMSANAFADDIKRSREAGVNEHLVKPFDLSKLTEILSGWMNSR